RVLTCNTTLSVGTWYLLSATYDGTNVRGYVNGVLDGSLAGSGALQTSDYPIRIGAYAPLNGSVSKGFWPGLIDEPQFYGRALAAAEINAIYAAGPMGVCMTPPTPACAPQAPNLAGWWPGNGNTQDIIGNQNGTVQNGAAFAAGEVGQSFSFNGTNQWVEVPSSTNLKPVSQLTISAWIKLSVAPSGQGAAAIAKGVDAESRGDWELGVTAASKLVTAVNSGGVWRVPTCNTTLSVGTWYLLSATYDGTNVRGYVNGVLDG